MIRTLSNSQSNPLSSFRLLNPYHLDEVPLRSINTSRIRSLACDLRSSINSSLTLTLRNNGARAEVRLSGKDIRSLRNLSSLSLSESANSVFAWNGSSDSNRSDDGFLGVVGGNGWFALCGCVDDFGGVAGNDGDDWDGFGLDFGDL